jgi:methylmalonyl-CoA epimerase
MDRPMTVDLTDLAGRLSRGGSSGIVELPRSPDRQVLVALAAEHGADLAILDAPTTKAALLDTLRDGLRFPVSSGRNWDALDELLSYPDPSPARPALIVWFGPDHLPEADARVFREIVANAVQRRSTADGAIVLVIVRSAMPGTPHLPDPIRGLGKVHHVALIVASIEESLGLWRDMLGLELETIMDIEHDRVRIAFLGVGESKVELVQPTDETTGVARFLANKGEGFHHVCFEVPNLAETLLRLEIDGLELLDAAPRRGAEGPVAFIHPRSCHGVLVELIEAPGGPAWTSLGFVPGD